MMKRASVSFDQFHDDEEGQSKSKYQTLLKEYLELQKEFVSRKRKLQAVKKKREAILAEVRFLRHRHKFLMKSEGFDMDRDQVSMKNYEVQAKQLEGERDCSTSEGATQSLDQVRVTNSQIEDEGEDGIQQVPHDQEPIFAKIPNDYLIHDKGLGKRKISWPDQVFLKV